MRPAPNHYRGFTLIEILIVIGIILLLLAGLFVMLGRLKESARRHDSKKQMELISLALETYHLDFRAFPPDSHGGRSGSQSLHYFLTTTFSKTPDAARGEKQASVNVSLPVTFEQRYLAEPVTLGSYTLVDPWLSPLHYHVEKRKFHDPSDATVFVTLDAPVIYSFGPNKIDDGGTGDDIVGTR